MCHRDEYVTVDQPENDGGDQNLQSQCMASGVCENAHTLIDAAARQQTMYGHAHETRPRRNRVGLFHHRLHSPL